MKIIVVLLTHIDNLPPARNLLLGLNKCTVNIELITMYSYALPEEIKNSTTIRIHDMQDQIALNKLDALKKRMSRRKKVRKLVQKLTEKDDVIWTVTDYDAMEVGGILNQHRHVMQLMELIHDIPLFDELPCLKAHIQSYAKTAELVIVPEYNRAHIQQAYWNLKETPRVIPNKPTVYNTKFNIAEISEEADLVLQEIGNRKIVLYQGTFGYERVLDQFIEGVELLGDEYCMLLMGRDDEELRLLLRKYPNTFFIPFISPPKHLAITSKAHIGVLSYVNSNNIRHYDPLNALYCAPNKLYEYACFGVPMLGNDIPGLEIPFRLNNIGRCSKLESTYIAEAIQDIDKNYAAMSNNCRNFYDSIDVNDIIGQIVEDLFNNK